MKKSFLLLALLYSSHAFAKEVTVDDTYQRPGLKTISIMGGKGSAAEAIFNQMSEATQNEDQAMGGRVEINRYGPELMCSKRLQSGKLLSYSCSVELNSNGSFISSNHD